MSKLGIIRKTITATAVLGLAAFIVAAPITPVFAVTSTQTASSTERMTKIKGKADDAINDRITKLNALLDQIKQIKRLSDGEKSKYISSITTEISNLQALKAKIDADTDLTTLIADAKSIYSTYRVYAIYMPQIHMQTIVDVFTDTSEKFDTLSKRFDNQIQAAKSAGKDTTSLEALYNDMQAKLVDAKTQYSQVDGMVIPLTPQGYPGNVSTVTAARALLQKARDDFRTAREDAGKIREGLKQFQPTGGSSNTNL